MKKWLLSLLLLITAQMLQAQTAVLYQTGFQQPGGLTLDASGSLYIAIAGSSVVKKAPDGTTVATYTGFNSPLGLAFDTEGNLYVASQFRHDIVKVDNDGNQTTFAAGFTVPTGIAFDALGNLFVANYAAGTISKVDGSGSSVSTFASGIANPLSIVIDASGNLFVSSYSSNTVIKFDASGHIEATYTGFSSPSGLALDAAGNLYSCSNSYNIGFIAAGSVDGAQPTSFISGLSFKPYSITYHDNALYATDGVSSVYKITGGTLTRQTHRYVDPIATGNNDGSSWADAYTDFQAAIDGATTGDSLFVAQATYQPASGASFTMKEGVKLFGGFLGMETDFNQRNLAHKVTLEGNGSYVILNDNNGLTAAALLDGFIITGGNANYGAGMNNKAASPTISHCSFMGNNANSGGAVYNVAAANPTITNCVFGGNSAAVYGGAIFNYSASPFIANCNFTENTSTGGDGADIYNYSSFPVIVNTIIWGNLGAKSIFDNSSTSTVTYSDLRYFIAGTGNVSQDPLFTDAVGGDYSLQSTSLILDAGTPDTTGLHLGTTDLIGNARVIGPVIDMGAYESTNTPLPVTLISFTGALKNNTADFQWQSGVEDDFNHFELQNGTDGNIFSTIARVVAKGSNSQYTRSVQQLSASAYYRLKVVDNNGHGEFSGTIHFLKIAAGRQITLYPNPAKDYIKVTLLQAGSLNIYDANGRLLKTASANKGVNRIDIGGLAAGVYYLKVNGEKNRFEKIK